MERQEEHIGQLGEEQGRAHSDSTPVRENTHKCVRTDVLSSPSFLFLEVLLGNFGITLSVCNSLKMFSGKF